MEVASGDASVDELRQRLLGGGGSSSSSNEEHSEADVAVPEDLLSIKSYIRWERNGKQNYSPEKQEASETAPPLSAPAASGVQLGVETWIHVMDCLLILGGWKLGRLRARKLRRSFRGSLRVE